MKLVLTSFVRPPPQKTCKEQLTQLEVEGLEIKARIRNAAAKTPTVVTPHAVVQDEEEVTSTSKTSKVDDLDLSTKCVNILMKLFPFPLPLLA